ncbi:MAG: bifunctional 4-hydroxy-2-oxoglutarate aldolase/2-dehydro-3-deoxy-phosphogluconate aldolase [Acidimicrobiia bacterium]
MARHLEFDKPPVIGIIRHCPLAHVEGVVKAAVAAGLSMIEIALGSEGSLASIERVRTALPEISLGAGTVLRTDEVDAAVDSGASFIVSPMIDRDLIERCSALDIPCIPGAGTVTEIWTALQLDVQAVKVFPAEQLGGPAFLQAVRAPLGDAPLVPTGGIDASNAAAYLKAGAVALGVGTGIFPQRALAEGDVEQVRSLTAGLLKQLA